MFRVVDENGIVSIHFIGRLDALVCLDIHEELMPILDKLSGSVVFDLRETDFVASSFISLCITTYKKVGPGNFSIVNAKTEVKNVFTIAGLNEMLGIT